MSDVTINQLNTGIPNKGSAIIPYSDGTTTYKTSPSGIVAASPGCLLQVKQTYLTEYNDIQLYPNSWSDITTLTTEGQGSGSLSCSIVPKTLTSKIIVKAIINWDRYGALPLFRLLRESTPVGNSTSGSQLNGFAGGFGFGSQYGGESSVIEFLDSPTIGNLSSSITYKVQVGTTFSNNVWRFNRSADNNSGFTSSITLWEIAG